MRKVKKIFIPEITLVNNPETGELIPEIWRDIHEWEGIYQVSNYGRVKSLPRLITTKLGRSGFLTRRERLRKSTNNGWGTKIANYFSLTLSYQGRKRGCFVHRLVAQAFIPNPENKPQVNHIDGNPSNNHVSNLEWCTGSENSIHALKTGLSKQIGSSNNKAKLSEAQVVEIKQTIKNNPKLSCQKIASRYGLHLTTIHYIKTGRLWKHIEV